MKSGDIIGEREKGEMDCMPVSHDDENRIIMSVIDSKKIFLEQMSEVEIHSR